MAAKQEYTLSGPGIDKTFELPMIALSRAITCATTAREPATFYVRDPAGEIFGRVEREESGTIYVLRFQEI